MMDPLQEAEALLDAIRSALRRVDPAAIDRLLGLIDEADAIFLAGAGRTGLMARAFGTRLAQIGIHAHVVGETSTPAITDRDLLVACSASGRKQTVLASARAAREMGASLAVFTADPESPLARLADLRVVVAGPCPPHEEPDSRPLGTRFEESLLLLFDAATHILMTRRGTTEQDMLRRHANLE